MLRSLVILGCFLLSCADCARILLLHLQQTGHAIDSRNIGLELVQRGNQVYAALAANHADKDTLRVDGITDIEFNDVNNPNQRHFLSSDDYSSLVRDAFFSGNADVGLLRTIASHVTTDCRNMLEDKKFINKLKSLKLDLVLVDRLHFGYCLFLLPHVLKVPFTSIGASAEAYIGSRPSLPSFSTHVAEGDWALLQTDRKTFSQRLVNMFHQIYTALNTRYDLRRLHDHQLLAQYAPGFSSYKDLVDQSKIFFMIKDYILTWPQVTMPNVVFVPSVTMGPPGKLDNAIQQIADSSAANGLIVVSFGSIGSQLPAEVVTKLLSAFGQLQQTVIWSLKIDRISPSIQNIPANVKIVPSLPQNDLLGHANVKLFITNGENNALYESLYHAVPPLVLPFVFDQTYNAFVMEQKGYGLSLDVLNVTPDELVKAVTQITTGKKFYTKAKLASDILRDYPLTSRQTVAFWIEHVIKFGDSHLRSHAMELTWYQFFMFDVIGLLLLIVFIVLYIIYRIFRLLIRKLRGVRQVKDSDNKTKKE